jgi:hypothetical protein
MCLLRGDKAGSKRSVVIVVVRADLLAADRFYTTHGGFISWYYHAGERAKRSLPRTVTRREDL